MTVPTRESQLRAHIEAVGRFLSDLYAVMIDPLAEGQMSVEDMCAALMEQAIKDRESLRQYHEIKVAAAIEAAALTAGVPPAEPPRIKAPRSVNLSEGYIVGESAGVVPAEPQILEKTWYPCACGAEHDTPTCPFGVPPEPSQ